ncbi:hypothetical protein [Citrobacter rodentium]|uniref:Membrane protein n=2 Tax=Citrobacter rodentium TaxID=67825 RepID=D2TJG5_CITRI|nr:hypothetical protein [Citrobacter rodentium]KIQ49601.1 membrane protein [Citrobacter rodentium]QBY28202.1 hypothetical protein E2R62_04610 [Citrobacter rodentium]UHO29921.1 hypothetical protein K7R23_18215 [Citrobacter rodentium NBRC 105723 = DSM 16636]CBG88380.1 putative membrane protein [Citrobacter rodentium ICC168]HAT8011581.1 hypothetical protein [Citrobacter rodentium NBRC 105723 = DSM 16636]
MNSHSLLKNSSVLIAYMGCLGWGSAYFYGWGISFYYGFPWWMVSAGVDDVARSLFYAVMVMGGFLFGWGIGLAFFFAIKRKNTMQDLNILRLYLAVLLLFAPIIIEFSILKQHFQTRLLLLSAMIALIVTVAIRFYGHLFSVFYFSQQPIVRKHNLELIMAFFVAYFWFFSFLTGYYKPQLKKEYEMIIHKNSGYYVLARYDNCLVLSKTFKAGSQRFIVFRPEQNSSFEVNVVRTRL